MQIKSKPAIYLWMIFASMVYLMLPSAGHAFMYALPFGYAISNLCRVILVTGILCVLLKPLNSTFPRAIDILIVVGYLYLTSL